jgi:hypothetical protein
LLAPWMRTLMVTLLHILLISIFVIAVDYVCLQLTESPVLKSLRD